MHFASIPTSSSVLLTVRPFSEVKLSFLDDIIVFSQLWLKWPSTQLSIDVMYMIIII
jgi:hypothetical protein